MATPATPRRTLVHTPHRVLGALLTLLFAAFLVSGTTGVANAADGYRYWNYFHLQNGDWAFSQVGPSDYQPEDGAVEAYRFGTSTTADGLPPRADLAEVNFDTVCESTTAADGQKRVAVLIDYGSDADADDTAPPRPRADCAVVAQDANGLEVLNAVADVRAEKGLTCALDGYPVKGCGEPVADAPASADEATVAFQLPASDDAADTGANAANAANGSDNAAADDGDSGLLWPLVGVAAVVVVIAGAGLALNRRGRTA